jgi:hypothetical protein
MKVGKKLHCELRSLADVFVPKFWVLGDEPPHQIDASRIVFDYQFDTATAHVVLGAPEGLILTHDNFWDFV